MWLYYHRLTHDALWTLIGEYIAPGARRELEGRRLGDLRKRRAGTEGAGARRPENDVQASADLLQELEWFEAELRKTAGKAGPTALEVLANIDAMQLAVDEAAAVERFNLKQVLRVHHQLMARAPNAHVAGRVRTAQNWIGGNDYNPCGADFVPPPPEHVALMAADLCDAVNDDVLPPLVQAALVHARFETIHPFDDGNGRTGRTLIHVVLRRRGTAPAYVPPISVVLARAKDRYVAGLTEFREDRIAEWIDRLAGAAATAARLATAYLGEVQALSERWRAQLAASAAAPRADAAAWTVIEILPAHPLMRSRRAPTCCRNSSGSRPIASA